MDQIQAHNWIGATETTWGQLTFLDAGDLDFRRYLRILRQEGFNGWISVEHAAGKKPPPTRSPICGAPN